MNSLIGAISRTGSFQFVWKVVVLVAIAYVGICVLLFVAQRKMIYLPSRTNAMLPAGFEAWMGSDGKGGTELWGFKRVAVSEGATNCLFFFHGNGGNASGWAHAVEEFPGDVFVLEYPGYGERPGSPSEGSIKAAAVRAFEAEVVEAKRYAKVILCGQSLGSGVTEAIFTMHPEWLDALVLVTPYLSLAAVASTHYAWIPTGLLLRDKMELYDAFLRFPGKSVVVTAADDEVIPRSHALRYQAATNANRAVMEFPASHNTIDLDRAFWEKVITGKIWKSRD